jgi:hypothetical protein
MADEWVDLKASLTVGQTVDGKVYESAGTKGIEWAASMAVWKAAS